MSVCREMCERPVIERLSEQDATVTTASARRRRSIGAVASISSKPSARRMRTLEGILPENFEKAYFLAFLEPEDFLDSFLVDDEESDDEPDEDESELLSDDDFESDEFEESEEPESPELSFLSPPPVFL